ncbi:MAG: hypothetical protein U0232_06845 [Thermomicrobiales bacterium]
MSARTIALSIAVALCGGGLVFAAVAIATIPLGLGGPGFGYKKLLLLLAGLETAGCGVLLWRRIRNAEWRMRNAE